MSEPNTIISRSLLFGNPHRASVKISPDGKYISFLADHDGVLNVWIAPANTPGQAKVITNDRTTGISQYFWAYTSQHILFLQDNDGDEDFHLYSSNIETTESIDLTPFKGIAAQVNHVSHRYPEEVLVGINDRGEHWFHDIYRINVVTGQRELMEENNGFIGYVADDEYQLRLAITLTAESDMVLLKRQSGGDWEPFVTIPSSEVMTTTPISVDHSGKNVFMLDSRERDKAAITSLDLASGQCELVFASDVADVNGILTHPTLNHIQAVSFTYDREQHVVLDESVKADFDYLQSICDGELEIANRTVDESLWLVSMATDDGPVKYYLYDRENRDAKFLFSHRPELDSVSLSKMQSVIIESRDGLNLVSYLTLPAEHPIPESGLGQPSTPLPMILLVHGGPWHRDYWGYHPIHQLFANRGYAVLSVNFRGSTGMGKSFINAANMEWAGKMHNDLIDAVNWAVENQIADKDKIAIMGGSYGGYATLVGLTRTPDVFACGIDIVGPSNLITLMENPPPYWMPIMPLMTTRVGDPSTEEGRKFLESRSPLSHVNEICRPLLIGQGANDPRVKQAESDQIVASMNEKNIPVTYVLYPEEGHGFDRPENDISFYAICEAFLAEHLGGNAEPVGSDFEGANFEIKSGMDQVPSIESALAKK